LARDVYEAGALASIRAKDSESFTRYVSQLTPFYELPSSVLPANNSERNKITGLRLLLLLTQGLYSEFHSELEQLSSSGFVVEQDKYLGYPIKLERWLMEGSYDRVWKAMKKGEVPCEEFGVFSEVCTKTLPTPTTISKMMNYADSDLIYRFSPTKFAARLPRPASAHTHPFPCRPPNPSCSSIAKAPSSISPAAAAGL